MLESFGHPRHGAHFERTFIMNETLLVEPMLEDYPAGVTPGWTHSNEGHHIVVNSVFGQLEVGMVPGKGYDQWLFHENNGGGSLVIGWYREYFPLVRDLKPFGPLQIMMLKADRFNLKGDEVDWELPGGFVDAGETKLYTAIRETIEETDQLVNPAPVQGRGYVGNRAFFALNFEDEGTSVFEFMLTQEQVEAIERSDKLQLMTPHEAICTTRDALSGMAIGRFVLNNSHLLQ
jgi:ADP-ribose pyrophosphatase YjhB (NUDIX family)